MMMPTTTPPPPRIDVSASENSLVVIRFEGSRDVFITVPTGREKRVSVSQTAVDHERSQVVSVPAGSAVTVHTPHHGDVLIPTMTVLGPNPAAGCRLPPFQSLQRVALMHAPPPPPLQKLVPTPSVAYNDVVKAPPRDPLTVKRLDITRRGREMWVERSKQIEAGYRTLIAKTPACPLCGVACDAGGCSHYSMQAVDAWLEQNTCQNKARAMTFNLLTMELTGVIQTRRAPGPETFMGITRFFIDKSRRTEFNRAALVPEWWSLVSTDPIAKGAVESWRSLVRLPFTQTQP